MHGITYRTRGWPASRANGVARPSVTGPKPKNKDAGAPGHEAGAWGSGYGALGEVDQKNPDRHRSGVDALRDRIPGEVDPCFGTGFKASLLRFAYGETKDDRRLQWACVVSVGIVVFAVLT
jgi:hypothetical protein